MWMAGDFSKREEEQLLSSPASRIDNPAGVEPRNRDIPVSPAPTTARRSGLGSASSISSLPPPRVPQPDSCGARAVIPLLPAASCNSIRIPGPFPFHSVPPQSTVRQLRPSGRNHFRHAVIRSLSPFAGGDLGVVTIAFTRVPFPRAIPKDARERQRIILVPPRCCMRGFEDHFLRVFIAAFSSDLKKKYYCYY